MDSDRLKKDGEHDDPITGAPGAHPVGTGVGAAGGGAAGAAIGGAVGGPVGVGVGVVAGAVAGGLAGKGAAEGGTEEAHYRGRLDELVGYGVVDRDDERIGTVDCVYADAAGEPSYLGIKTGWFSGVHVVPAERVQLTEKRRRLRLPYSVAQVKEAPTFDRDLDEGMERQVCTYYGECGVDLGRRQAPAAQPSMPEQPTRAPSGAEDRTLQLQEEELKVGKREVEAGGVRLRKIVRTETVEQPVEVKREDVVIERVPAGEQTRATGEFSDEEIYIPLRREEAVVEKTARVREEVRARKTERTEQERISETVRSEDVEIDDSRQRKPGESRPFPSGRPRVP